MNTYSLVILCIIVMLIACYLGYQYIIRGAALIVNALFILGLIGALSVVFLADSYQKISINYLGSQYIGQQLLKLDSALLDTQESIDQINLYNPFVSKDEDSKDEKWEAFLFQATSNLIGDLLKLFILIISLLSMILSIYLKYTITGYVDSTKLQKQIDELERKIDVQH